MPREAHPTSTPAVVIADTGAVASHAQLAHRAASLHALLLELGLQPGDTLALLSPHRLEVFEVERAARRAGMHFVAIDPIWTVEETAYVVNDSGAQVIFTSAEDGTRAAEIAPLTPYVHTRFCFDGSTAGHESYGEAVSVHREAPEPTPSELRLFYSAGTLGRPYGVRRRGLVAATVADQVELTSDTRFFSASPLSDGVAAQLYSAVLDVHGTVVTFGRFDPQAAQAAFTDHRPTVGHVLPLHLLQVMKGGLHADVAGLEVVVLSSAPCPPEAKRWLINAVGPGVLEIYGTTECDVIATNTAEEWLEDPVTYGPGGDARLVEDVLAVHPKVADAAVLLVPATAGDVEVRALVVPLHGVRTGQGLERELIAFNRGRLPKGPTVHRVDFVESLPRSASGRLVRRRLAARFVLSDGLAV